MSNRNYLQPSINPGVNPEFKGDVTIDGDLIVSGETTTDDLVVTNESTIPIIHGGEIDLSGSLEASGLVITGSAALPAGSTIGGLDPTLLTFSGDVPTIQTAGTVSYFPVPVSGRLVSISACPQAAIATADATLTVAINGTNVTGGLVTLPVAGAAAGKPSQATPTLLNAVALTDILRVTVGGGNTTATTARMVFTIRP